MPACRITSCTACKTQYIVCDTFKSSGYFRILHLIANRSSLEQYRSLVQKKKKKKKKKKKEKATSPCHDVLVPEDGPYNF